MDKLKIGIVAEGISDYWVLKHLLGRVMRDDISLIVPLKPKEKPNGKQDGWGSWQGVFEYIADKGLIIDEAVTEGCDYIVVQIDTDVAEQYEVTKSDDFKQLYSDVVNKLLSRVHTDFDKSKLIFAICIDSLECWLIPFVTTQNCNATTNCVNVVNRSIQAKKCGTIDSNSKGDSKRAYDYILSQKKKAKEISEISVHNYGFQKFIKSLQDIITSRAVEQTDPEAE